MTYMIIRKPQAPRWLAATHPVVEPIKANENNVMAGARKAPASTYAILFVNLTLLDCMYHV